MRNIFSAFFMLVFLFELTAQTASQNKDVKQTTFTVHGDCIMCKKRIENAATSVFGVRTAVWDKEYQMLTITYDPRRTKLDKVHQAIADAGHDTEKVKASNKAYKKLPECCRYRDKKK